MEYRNQDNLKQGILNYLEMSNTGALMVTGSWGCGKSYFFENVLFKELRDKVYKPVRVSLFGMSDLNELSKNIVCEFAQYASDKNWLNSTLKLGANVLKEVKDIPVIGDYINVKGIWGEGKALYKLIPPKAVVCLDDLERAVEKFDINDLLGVINDLVENQHLKVIVIANKEYIDERQNVEKEKHEIFYEKVIEKTLHFEPCILDVFKALINAHGDDKFKTFMLQDTIVNSINPILTRNKRLKKQKENIRTLKFAVSHFKALFDDYVQHGVNVVEETINKQLVNHWLFVYAISLESKRSSLSVDDSMGLDHYVPTANNFSDIDFGDEYEENPFDEKNEEKDNHVDIAKDFVSDYYGDLAMEYIFYPDIYKFVLGGINFDFDEHLDFTQKAFERFDYKGNPAQEELAKWMNGYWKMTDDEAAESLKRLLNFVHNGELTDFISYFNASVFLLKCCGLIEKNENEVLTVFDEGLTKFSQKVVIDAYTLSTIEVLPVNRSEPCAKVYDKILEIIDEKQKCQVESDIEEMKCLFHGDISAFIQMFVPNGTNTPIFYNKPVLHLLSDEDFKIAIDNALPDDFMNLYSFVSMRYNNDLIIQLLEEKPFIMRLKEVVKERGKDKTRLSSIIIHDQLLPALEKVERRMDMILKNK